MREQIVDRPTVDSGAKWFVVVNPISGSGKGLDDFPLISKLLRDNNIRCETVFTEHKCHATELTVSAITSGYRHIIVVGGDGTLHEVVNGLFIQNVVEPHEVTVAVKRNVDILGEETSQCFMPAIPEFRNGNCFVGGVKIDRQIDVHHFAKADSHIAITAEVKINLNGISQRG